MNLGEKVIYQVYPKSFYDSTGNGKGDLAGVIEKLDYIADLGVDLIWLNPFYPSPQKDNGYDISDYCAIDPTYGTMADFERLIAEAEKRGISLMLDMVLNHTSIEHEWFQKALAGDPEYQDFYYLRPAKADGSLPTNWQSKFGGPAWEKFGDTSLYYLPLYDVSQADLNWHNPKVRQALYQVINFWLAKGVKGLRFDVLNVIGKDPNFQDSQEPGSNQEKHLYTDTPIVHQWIKEMHQATFGRYDDIVTVGEMSSTDVANGIRYSNPTEQELSMIFSFHHLKVDYQDGEKWSDPEFDFIALKQILDTWQKGMSDHQGWNALFLNNHDQPRSNSRFGDVIHYPYETQTMLATAIQCLRGTPYIYQGEEIGMTDPGYQSIDDYVDVETLNHYQILQEKGYPIEKIMNIIRKKSRDNSRTPMQWDSSKHAGFTKGTPWLKVADNYQTINVERARKEGKIYKYYQDLIQLRKDYPIIQEGSYQGIQLDHPQIMAYERQYQGQFLLVVNNFYAQPSKLMLPSKYLDKSSQKLIGNGPLQFLTEEIMLQSYETAVFLLKDG